MSERVWMGFRGTLVTDLESEVQKASIKHPRLSQLLCGRRSKTDKELDSNKAPMAKGEGQVSLRKLGKERGGGRRCGNSGNWLGSARKELQLLELEY